MNRQFSRIGLAAALCSSLFLAGCDDDDDSPEHAQLARAGRADARADRGPGTRAAHPIPDDHAARSRARARRSSGKVKTVTPPTARIGGQVVMLTRRHGGGPRRRDHPPVDLQRDELVRVRGIRIDSDGTTVIAEKITVQFERFQQQ